jgi:hypothetical protein
MESRQTNEPENRPIARDKQRCISAIELLFAAALLPPFAGWAPVIFTPGGEK